MNQSSWNPQRVLLGVTGSLMLLFAMLKWFTVGITDDNAMLLGVCSKVGLVLLAIFLAWPSLEKFIDRAPMAVNGLLLAGIVFIAIRPRLMPLVVGLVVITLVVHFGLRFASIHSRR